MPDPAYPAVEAQLDKGKKIAAIKAYREETGADLKEAKDEVERLARSRTTTEPVTPHEDDREAVPAADSTPDKA